MTNADMRQMGNSRPNRVRSAEEVRQGILTAAQEQFREHGYERSSLQQIGTAVGLTRGAVLYHYGSKAELLEALLAPFVTQLETALADFESRRPPPRPRAVLESLLDALLDTRAAAELLMRDTSSRQAIGLDQWVGVQADRLVRLLSPESRRDPSTRIRGYAALGAITRPLVVLPDPISAADRRAVLTAAGAALRPPRRR